MRNEMTPIRIDIPDKRLSDVAWEAGGIVMEALRQEGVDLRKAAVNPMVRELCRGWAHGEMDEAGFRRSCRNMLILNPGLGV